ncbi:hypothetical protein [Kushneria marisflavi]|uniref:Uncharacterized protein n=1 Tax=Kushneria marisflavi TaxID=157779 RepID=A0A240UT17_9GAMM|nr:hypothetical protein [Kushneria marisflavi]ART64223.1 hypothetical protein B9H00_15170 [Kushneria marisflavi]RKD76681.1 hypothetical protein C8D96_3062 [Kushneria marisflavi]
MNRRRSSVPAFSLAMAAGAAIWALSPLASGHTEPWDSALYYSVALVLAGIGSALVTSGPLSALHAGCLIGQILFAMTLLPIEPLFVVGIGFMLAWSLLFLASAGLCLVVRPMLIRAFRQRF